MKEFKVLVPEAKDAKKLANKAASLLLELIAYALTTASNQVDKAASAVKNLKCDEEKKE